MATNLKMASERRKLQLRATVLNLRQRRAADADRIKRAREELAAMSPSRGSKGGGNVTGLPVARLGGR